MVDRSRGRHMLLQLEQNNGAEGGNRTLTSLAGQGILSPLRLPVPPPPPAEDKRVRPQMRLGLSKCSGNCRGSLSFLAAQRFDVSVVQRLAPWSSPTVLIATVLRPPGRHTIDKRLSMFASECGRGAAALIPRACSRPGFRRYPRWLDGQPVKAGRERKRSRSRGTAWAS